MQEKLILNVNIVIREQVAMLAKQKIPLQLPQILQDMQMSLLVMKLLYKKPFINIPW